VGAYNKSHIQAAITEGTIVCVPLRDTQIGPQGLLISLGNYYYRAEQGTPGVTHNPFDAEDAERYFEGPFKASPHTQQCSLSGLKPISRLAPEQSVVLLGPGQCIVAHSHEFIAAHDTAHLDTLPSWQQSGIAVIANFTHLSQIARLSLVIRNTNQHKHILLPVGAPIAQLIFDGAPTLQNATRASGAPRFASMDIDSAISVWTPSAILAPAMPLPAGPPPVIEGLRYA